MDAVIPSPAQRPFHPRGDRRTDPRPILLVEDNEDDVLLTQRAFRKAGVPNEVVVVRDGQEALAALNDGRFRNSLPSFVLLDLKLPQVDGAEVLRRLRSDPRTQTLRVVVLSSSREERDIRHCAELGANSFIRKPVDFDDFLHSVQILSAYWLHLDESATES